VAAVNFSLDGDVALVTGAASGIGRAIAQAIAGSGAPVGLVDLTEQASDDTASEISDAHGRAVCIAADVTGLAQLRGAIEQGIELAEKVSAAGFRLARKAVQRFDDAANETLTGTERLLGGAVRSARETTNAAAQLATTAVSGVAASA